MENKNEELQEKANLSRDTPGHEESNLGGISGQLPQNNQLKNMPRIIIYSPSEDMTEEQKNVNVKQATTNQSGNVPHIVVSENTHECFGNTDNDEPIQSAEPSRDQMDIPGQMS